MECVDQLEAGAAWVGSTLEWLGRIYVPRKRETFEIGRVDRCDRLHSSLLRGYWVPFARSGRTLLALATRTSAPATTGRSRAGR